MILKFMELYCKHLPGNSNQMALHDDLDKLCILGLMNGKCYLVWKNVNSCTSKKTNCKISFE